MFYQSVGMLVVWGFIIFMGFISAYMSFVSLRKKSRIRKSLQACRCCNSRKATAYFRGTPVCDCCNEHLEAQ